MTKYSKILDLPSFQVDLLISYSMYSNGTLKPLTVKNSSYFIRTQRRTN